MPKNHKWTENSFSTELRVDCAQIQNEVLEKNGFSIRVDHRSLKAQKEEAERLQFLRQDLLKSIKIVNNWKCFIISCHDSEQQAKLEYMTKDDCCLRFFYHTYATFEILPTLSKNQCHYI